MDCAGRVKTVRERIPKEETEILFTLLYNKVLPHLCFRNTVRSLPRFSSSHFSVGITSFKGQCSGGIKKTRNELWICVQWNVTEKEKVIVFPIQVWRALWNMSGKHIFISVPEIDRREKESEFSAILESDRRCSG